MKINIYPDASLGCDKNLGVAGLGCVIENPITEEKYTVCNWIKCDDINVAEMNAILMGLDYIRSWKNVDYVRIISDSKTCVESLLGKEDSVRERTPQQKYNKIELNKAKYQITQLCKKYNKVKISHITSHKPYFNRYNINNSLADVLSRDGIRLYLDSRRRIDERYKRNESWINRISGFIKDKNK